MNLTSATASNGTPVFVNNYRRGEADFTSTGANKGKLSSRPDRYVPFLVPVSDEISTEYARLEYQKALKEGRGVVKPNPAYRWLYRPRDQWGTPFIYLH